METLITCGRIIWFLKAKLQMKVLMRKETDWNKSNIFKEPIKLGKSFELVPLGFLWDSIGTWVQAKGMLGGQEERWWSADHQNATTPSLFLYTKMQLLIPVSFLTLYFHADVKMTVQHVELNKVWLLGNLSGVVIMSHVPSCPHNARAGENVAWEKARLFLQVRLSPAYASRHTEPAPTQFGAPSFPLRCFPCARA